MLGRCVVLLKGTEEEEKKEMVSAEFRPWAEIAFPQTSIEGLGYRQNPPIPSRSRRQPSSSDEISWFADDNFHVDAVSQSLSRRKALRGIPTFFCRPRPVDAYTSAPLKPRPSRVKTHILGNVPRAIEIDSSMSHRGSAFLASTRLLRFA